VNLDQWDARVASTHLTNRTIISPRMNSGMMQFLGTQIPRRSFRSSFMSKALRTPDIEQRRFGVIKLFFEDDSEFTETGL
jgi:hypothetical protein